MKNTWNTFFEEEKNKSYFYDLNRKLDEEYNKHTVFPERQYIYRAFDLTPLESLSVVILGQDPYHGRGQAEGLSFSVQKDVRFPPSLRNIFKELKNDLEYETPENGSLIPWAEQGVFLLNTSLTVREKDPASHAKIGWQTFTDNAIKYINDNTENVVFILWGGHAQKKNIFIDDRKHHIIKSSHPSPFSAHKGFLDSKVFSKTNSYLKENKKKQINWKL